MSNDTIDLGYKPRPYQLMLHKKLRKYRWSVVVWHRRAGKTVFALRDMVERGLSCPKKNPQFAYVAPNYSQAKRVAWAYVKEFTEMIPGVKYNEKDLKCTIPRPWLGDSVSIMLLGAENPDSLRGIYLMGAVLDEYASMMPSIFNLVIRPALSDHQGWATFIGTPSSRNHFYDLYMTKQKDENWFCTKLTVKDTNIIPEHELKDARSLMSEEEYRQEFMCDFSAISSGAYFAKYMNTARDEGRVRTVPYDASTPVYTGWDLGIGDSMSIWFAQRVNNELHLIDYIEENGKGLEYYVKELKAKPYVYEEHYVPHDAAARELGTGKSRMEMLAKFGLRNVTLVKRHQVADGIQECRNQIHKAWFDDTKCHQGIICLENYSRKFDEKNGVFMVRPKHDWTSHGADAFRTLCMGFRVPAAWANKNLPRQAELDYNTW